MNNTSLHYIHAIRAKRLHFLTYSFPHILWCVILSTVLIVQFGLRELSATTLHGRLSTTFYGFEQEERHFELSEKIALALKDIGHPGISANMSFQLKKDLAHNDLVDKKLWGAFLDWRGGKNQARVGRQSISACVRRISIDGLMLKTGYRRMVSIMAYAGTEGTDSLKIDSWHNSHIIGARLSILPIPPAQFNMSWMRTEQENDQIMELFGTDLRVSLRRLSIYSFLGYDAARSSVSDFLARAAYNAHRNVIIFGDFQRRRPLFSKRSIFSTFSFEPAQRVRVGIQWKIRRDMQVFSQYSLLYLEGDPSHGIETSIGNRILTIGYSYSTGYGGELSGITCSFKRRLLPHLELYGSGRLGWYKRASTTDEEHTDSAVRIGGSYWVKENWSFGLCGEHLAGSRYRYDTRIMVKTTLVLRAGSRN